MRLKEVSRLVLMFLLIGLSFARAEAQVPTADVVGTVTDNSGGAIPNAQITIKNLATGQTRTTRSSGSGEYAFTLLQIGTYSVTVTANGFKTFNVPSIGLSTSDKARIDAKMEIGEMAQSVQVEAIAPALQTESATVSGLIEERVVQNLPMNGRNFVGLAQLTPGTSEGNPVGHSSGTRPDDRRQSSEISANGQNDALNNKLIDGMDNNEKIVGTIGVVPSIDAIQEVRVQTNLYSAEVGRTAGAVIDVITKSGTNSLHGSAFEFFRNDALNARDFFNTVGSKSEYRQNQYGGSVGGPIKKDKAFFFGDYEGLRLVQQMTPPLLTVPTDCELGRATCNGVTQLGNFSDISTILYDPTTAAPFPGNIIPTSRISVPSRNFASLYPSQNLPGLTNNFVGKPKRTQYLSTYDVKIDDHLSESDLLTGRYTFNQADTLTPGTFPAVSVAGLTIKPGGQVGGSSNFFAGPTTQRAQNMAVSYSHIFSPTLLMQLNVGYLRYALLSASLNYGSNASQAFGLQGINDPTIASGFATGLPQLNITGYSNLGDDNFLPIRDVDNAFQYAGVVTWTKGSHVFKFGAGFINRDFAVVSSQFANANFVFNSVLTNSTESGTGTGGNAFASLLLGYPSAQNRNLSLVNPYYNTREPSFYAQDSWRALPWLTINYGVRYDIFTAWTEKNNQRANFDPVKGILVAASPTDRTSGIQTDHGDVAPRVGFAASLGHGTVVRGGFGTSYFPQNNLSQFQLKNPPFTSSFSLAAPQGAAPFTPPSFTTPLPPPVATPITTPNGNVGAIVPDYKSGLVYQTNLLVQKDFLGNVLSVGYVGAFGHRINYPRSIDSLNTPGPQPAGTKTVTAPNPAQPYFSTVPQVQFITQQTNLGTSNYHALTTQIERRYKMGLSISANYTYAHSIDNTANIGLGYFPDCAYDNCIEDLGNNATRTISGLRYEFGNADNDVRNRWVISVSYELPFGKTSTGFAKHLIAGWQIASIASWSSGLPFTVKEASPLTQTTGTGGNQPGGRPNLVGVAKLDHPTVNEWFNINAFAFQRLGTLGNEPRNQLFGPAQRRWDFSLFKTFPLTEQLRMELRTEVFNLTNTPNFNIPPNVSTDIIQTQGVTAGGFGRITTTTPGATPRAIQFAMKLLF